MIDYVRLSAEIVISEDHFLREKWRERRIPSGTLIRYHHFRGVWIRYYPEVGRMTINGKLLMLLEDTEVLNVDDVYERDVSQFVGDLNGYINALFTMPCISIAEFHVTRIDYCFNVVTPYVKEYIRFLNTAFRLSNNGKRVNYTSRNGLDGSVYIKTKSDYENNERRNYVLNFYDKTDRLKYLLRCGHRIGKYDMEYSRGVLRLEIQCGFQFIRHICKHFHIEPSFGCLLCYEIAYYAESTIYHRIFHCDEAQDFYTYKTAKSLILGNTAAEKTLRRASQGHAITDSKFDHGKRLIKEANIFPFTFLPHESHYSKLDNPLKLIRRKLDERGIHLSHNPIAI